MTEKEIKTYIQHFLEGNLSTEKEHVLLSWVKKTETNKNLFLREQEKLQKKLATSSNLQLTMRWQSLLSKIEAPAHKKRNIEFRKIASLAAAFIAGVIITVGITKTAITKNNQISQNITTPFGAKTHFQLPDGSSVWLNSGSELSYPSGFAKVRAVELQGEAFFEVKKGETPFIVSTEYGDVEVKGTSFNVKAFENEAFETTLIAGEVRVTEKNTKEQITLLPGQQADIFNSQVHIQNVDTELFTSWKDGRIIFREEYLPSAVKRLERWYNVTIELDDDPRLAKIWYSGTLEMESFSEVLELLKITAPISYQYNEKTRTIRIFYE